MNDIRVIRVWVDNEFLEIEVDGCANLSEVYFAGTQAQAEAIQIGTVDGIPKTISAPVITAAKSSGLWSRFRGFD